MDLKEKDHSLDQAGYRQILTLIQILTPTRIQDLDFLLDHSYYTDLQKQNLR